MCKLMLCIPVTSVQFSSVQLKLHGLNAVGYLLKVLRGLGLNRKGLDCVFSAVVLSRLIYAVEAWGNFVSKDQEGRINKTLKKAHKWGLSTHLFTFAMLQAIYAEKLFYKACVNPQHCLYHLLPPMRQDTCNYNLRKRKHDHQVIRAQKSPHRIFD